MSYNAVSFVAQSQLTTWTDELEFLCYIFCELIDAKSLSAVGHEYHQAVDFLTLSHIIRPHLEASSESLTHIMSRDELVTFRRLLRKATEIRHVLAHHGIITMDKFNRLESTKQSLCDVLEISIKKVASDRAIDQVCFDVKLLFDSLLIG